MEDLNNENYGKGKFNSPRDELLSAIAANGWADATSGHVNSRTGWFGRISNRPEDLAGIEDAFAEDVERLGRAALDGAVGHFLLREDELGFVNVTEHPTEAAVRAEFGVLQQVYDDWLEGRA